MNRERSGTNQMWIMRFPPWGCQYFQKWIAHSLGNHTINASYQPKARFRLHQRSNQLSSLTEGPMPTLSVTLLHNKTYPVMRYPSHFETPHKAHFGIPSHCNMGWVWLGKSGCVLPAPTTTTLHDIQATINLCVPQVCPPKLRDPQARSFGRKTQRSPFFWMFYVFFGVRKLHPSETSYGFSWFLIG